MSDPLAVMCERHEREHGGEEARWKARPLLDDTCHLCVMERENVALRKRVEELEHESGAYLRRADSVTGRCVEAEARAEKAEQERDKLAEGYERRRQELDAQYAEIKKLQADLDAALVLCVASDWDVEVLGAGYEPEVYKAHAHVLPLLEKRREGHHRGGWICSECGHAEQREREVLCWNCGKGEMQFNASLVFPLAPSEARRG